MRIDVVVLERGVPVTGLSAADFEITENGQPHEIVSFEPIVVRVPATPTAPEPVRPARVSEPTVRAPEENRYFLIFFDDVHLTALAAERARAQLVPFLELETREGDSLIEGPDERKRLSAASLLGAWGAGAKAALPALKTRLGTETQPFARQILEQAIRQLESAPASPAPGTPPRAGPEGRP